MTELLFMMAALMPEEKLIETIKESASDWCLIPTEEKKKELQMGRLPLCEIHFNKAFPKIKEAEKEMQKKDGKNTFWAFVPIEELNKALN
jgi:hypothetical protein